MQSLEKMLDEKKTVKEVRAHLKIFERLRTRIQIEDTILRKRADNNQGAANSRDYTIDRNIQTISKIDKKNDEIDRYQEWFFKKFNELRDFDRSILLSRYLYQLDIEDMCEKYGLGEKKVREKLRNAEINLAYILECVYFRKQR